MVEDLDGLGIERDDIVHVLRDLERAGYVDLEPRHVMHMGQAYPAARISTRGSAWVEDVRERRDDLAARARACRTELLLWLYDTEEHLPVTMKFLERNKTFYGAPFAEKDVTAAAKYLYDLDLISGVAAGAWGAGGAPLRCEITTDGRTCVEDFDADPASARTAVVSSTTYHQTIHNPTGSVAQGEGASAITHQGLTPGDVAQLQEVFARGLEAVSDPQEREDVEQAIQDVLDALQAEEVDADFVRRRLRSLQRLTSTLSNAALTAAASEGGKRVLELLASRF